MPAANGSNLVKSDIVANLFGVTTRRVQQLVKDGIITATKEKGVNKYDLPVVVKQYIRHLSEKVQGRESRHNSELDNQKLGAEIRIKESKARLAELQLQELEGKMHRSEDVEDMTTDLVFTIRGMLVALPGRLAVDLAGLDSPLEISERIRLEVNSILQQLANYRYDPAEYKRRAREREGWQGVEEDGPDE